MKTIINKILAIGVVAAALSSCSDDNLITEGEGAANFSVAIAEEATVASARVSNEAALAENCIVYVYSHKGLIRKYRGTNNLPSQLFLASGNYRVTAAAGDSVPASFTDRYFKGATDFTISAGVETPVNVECKIANSVVVVDFGNLADGLTDYKVTVSNAAGQLEYTSDKGGEKGYFMMDDGEKTLNWTLTGKQLDGTPYERSGSIDNVKPTTQYTLKYNYSSKPAEYGGAIITVEVAEEEIVTKDVIITAAPKFMLNGGRDINNPVVSQPEKFSSSIGVYCTSACALKSVVVKGEDNVLTAKLGLPDDEFDILSMSSDYSSTLAGKGLTHTYKYNDADDNAIAKITIAKGLLNSLTDGDYYINFVATDVKNKVRNYRMHIQITDASVGTIEINEENVYTSYATVYGSVMKQGLTGLKFRYRKSGETDWTSIDATVSGSTMSAKITGLTAGTTYEYQAISDGYMIADVMRFTTEEAAQLPNNSFEDWQTSSSPYLVYPAGGEMFWDTGNHGSSTMNKNVTVPSTQYVHSGSRSIDLRSQFVGIGSIGKFAAGNVFAGKYLRTEGTDGVLGFGRPFASRPVRVTGYVKYSPKKIDNNAGAVEGATGMDKGFIYVALWDDSKETDSKSGESWPKIVKTKSSERQLFDTASPHIIGYGELVLTEATAGSDLVKFTIDIKYRSSKKPSAIIFTCSASKYGDYFCGGNGTEMWLDDLQLEYE